MTLTSAKSAHRRSVCWTPEYCLAHCQGYRVVGPGGHLGYVDEVRSGPDGHVSALVVTGIADPVSTGLIEEIDPAVELIRLRETGGAPT
jgi:hypothetical protein